MSKLHGVDVSGWQPGIDTYNLTADFVIVKSTEGIQGTRYNPEYRRMADDAMRSGKLTGFYHYANGGDPIAEADCFYESIREYRGKATYTLDWERQGNRTFETGRDVQWCKQFMDRIDERMGGKCMLYTSKGVCNEYDWSPCKDHPMWGAEYAYDDYTYQGYQDEPWESVLAWGVWGKPCQIHQYGFVNPPNNGGYAKLDADIMHADASMWEVWCGDKSPKSPREKPSRVKVSLADVAATIHYDMCVDASNGYAQYPHRWGGDSPLGTKSIQIGGRTYTYKRGSYDCSSSVITAWRLALQGTPYEGMLDGATCTSDMRKVFLASGLFTWAYDHAAKRGDVYLAEGKHTAMCQDGGSDGVLGYDALSEFNRSEDPNNRYTGQVGDQDGYESVIRGFYDDEWNGIIYYNGKGDFYVDGDGEEIAEDKEGTDMTCFFARFDGDPTEHFWDGKNLHAIANADEKEAIVKWWKLARPGQTLDPKPVDFGSADAPWGARLNDVLSRGAEFKTFERFNKHPSLRATVTDVVRTELRKNAIDEDGLAEMLAQKVVDAIG